MGRLVLIVQLLLIDTKSSYQGMAYVMGTSDGKNDASVIATTLSEICIR